jgi:alkylation response protein AidB-like acyl-CoA dehydrogenase
MSEQPLAEFLEQATRFLDTAAGRTPAATSRPWGEGPDGTELLAEWSSEEEARLVTEARRFKALEYDAGFGWIDGPAVYGGRGLPRSYHEAYTRLREQFAVPDLAVMRLGLSMTAPTILAHGTEQVKRAYLPRLHRGDVIACQLFSEPDAGSDLASLRTSAVPDGRDWVLRGQKVWTTNAHLSDIGEVLCRTDPRAPKHRGITAFLIDMHAPGVEVRALRQMTGGASFNEVFLTDVRVPDRHRRQPRRHPGPPRHAGPLVGAPVRPGRAGPGQRHRDAHPGGARREPARARGDRYRATRPRAVRRQAAVDAEPAARQPGGQ